MAATPPGQIWRSRNSPPRRAGAGRERAGVRRRKAGFRCRVSGVGGQTRSQESEVRSQNEEHLVPTLCSWLGAFRFPLTAWVLLADQKPLLAGQQCSSPWAKPTGTVGKKRLGSGSRNGSTLSESENSVGMQSVGGGRKTRALAHGYSLLTPPGFQTHPRHLSPAPKKTVGPAGDMPPQGGPSGIREWTPCLLTRGK